MKPRFRRKLQPESPIINHNPLQQRDCQFHWTHLPRVLGSVLFLNIRFKRKRKFTFFECDIQFYYKYTNLSCCATNRKVVGSIPAGVCGFFIDIKFFRSHYGPGIDSASNRNEYQEYFLGVKAAGA